jgi:hypothetical protein
MLAHPCNPEIAMAKKAVTKTGDSEALSVPGASNNISAKVS